MSKATSKLLQTSYIHAQSQVDEPRVSAKGNMLAAIRPTPGDSMASLDEPTICTLGACKSAMLLPGIYLMGCKY